MTCSSSTSSVPGHRICKLMKGNLRCPRLCLDQGEAWVPRDNSKYGPCFLLLSILHQSSSLVSKFHATSSMWWSLDQQNGDIWWQEAIEHELKQINKYRTFCWLLPMDSLEDYQQKPYHFVFDVKFDRCCKAQLVTNGSKTEQPKDDIFLGVIGLESVWLTFLIAQMNGLQVYAADIGNAFLYGQTREKVYVKAGWEFGAGIAGQPLIINKGLYGLWSSSTCFHEHLSHKLQSIKYLPSKANPDLWIKDCGTH